MIEATGVGKTYLGLDFDRKESGIAMWIRNARKLTSNKAVTVRALHDVSFQTGRGTILGIFGANGAGKTTLIKILSGLLAPDKGTIIVNGHTGGSSVKDQISYISTNGWMGLEWQLTARENLILYGRIFGQSGRYLGIRADNILDLFGMTESKHKRVSQLSAGMRQKITLARGFLLDRPILYFDEPTVSLDLPSSIRLRRQISDAAHVEGKTVLLASHDQEDIRICDCILFLSKGQVLCQGTMQELSAPLSGITSLHLTCMPDERSVLDRIESDITKLEGVCEVQIHPADNARLSWDILVLLDGENCYTGPIIDRFLFYNVPMNGLALKTPTLQDIYQHYVQESVSEGDIDG